MTGFGEIDGVPVRITKHSLERMVQMEMTVENVKKVVCEPEDVYNSVKYPGRFFHRADGFSLCMIKQGDVLVVITALYGTLVDWIKADRDGKLPEDRPLQFNSGVKRF